MACGPFLTQSSGHVKVSTNPIVGGKSKFVDASTIYDSKVQPSGTFCNNIRMYVYHH